MRSIEDVQTDLQRIRDRCDRLLLDLLEGEHDAETVRVADELLMTQLRAFEIELELQGALGEGKSESKEGEGHGVSA